MPTTSSTTLTSVALLIRKTHHPVLHDKTYKTAVLNPMRFTLIFVSLFLLSACASISKPYYYNEIVVYNSTQQLIPHVVIRAKETQRMFSCRNIAPGAKCSNKSKSKKIKNSKLKITWTYNGTERTTDNFKITIPENMLKSLPLRGVISLESDGKVKFWLEQGKL